MAEKFKSAGGGDLWGHPGLPIAGPPIFDGQSIHGRIPMAQFKERIYRRLTAQFHREQMR